MFAAANRAASYTPEWLHLVLFLVKVQEEKMLSFGEEGKATSFKSPHTA